MVLTDERLRKIVDGDFDACDVCLTFDGPPEHQPGCEECVFQSRDGAAILSALIAARALLREIAARDSEPLWPNDRATRRERDWECVYCFRSGPSAGKVEHAPECLWVRARALVAATEDNEQCRS